MNPLPWVSLARPRQWIKNAFVLVGLLYSQRWGESGLIADVAITFAAFCAMSSAVYALNDTVDREADRLHPVKRGRPVASGAVPVAGALVLSLVLCMAGLYLASQVSRWAVLLAALYAALNVAYSLGAKHVAVLDVFMIAGGFMLRLLAGTIGVGIQPSQWLLLCGVMVTLFLGFVKRRAEVIALADGSVAHRRAMSDYSPALLDNMITVSASGVIVTYSLYTVSPETVALHGTDRLVLTLPFVLYGMFRYLFLLHARGGGGDPTRDLVRDPQLLAVAGGWVLATLYLIGAR